MALSIQNETRRLLVGRVEMEDVLHSPFDLRGVVLCAHGCGEAVGQEYVNGVLRDAKLGVVSIDYSQEEIASQPTRGDPARLLQRMRAVYRRVREHASGDDLPISLFCSGGGFAAAFQFAAAYGRGIAAIVARGGRPDVTHSILDRVSAPTLMIVGGLDDALNAANRAAFAALHCKKRLETVPGATHNFEEPGNAQVVARLTRAWLLQHA